MDVIFANDALADMLSLLEELGEKEVLIVYTKHQKEREIPKTSLKIKTAFLVKNSKEAQKYSKHYDALIGIGTRDIIESKLVTYVYGAEELSEKDKTHFRAGGLNQVLAKLIADKNKTYLFDLSSILNAERGTQATGFRAQGSESRVPTTDRRALLLGRMSFNKQILSKYGVDLLCPSMASTPLGLRAPKERKLFLENL